MILIWLLFCISGSCHPLCLTVCLLRIWDLMPSLLKKKAHGSEEILGRQYRNAWERERILIVVGWGGWKFQLKSKEMENGGRNCYLSCLSFLVEPMQLLLKSKPILYTFPAHFKHLFTVHLLNNEDLWFIWNWRSNSPCPMCCAREKKCMIKKYTSKHIEIIRENYVVRQLASN